MKSSETTYGTYDKKGHWKPPYACKFAPMYSNGSAKEILKYIFGWGGYLWPRMVIYLLMAMGTYQLLAYDISHWQGFTVPFILWMLGRNLLLMWLFFGGFYTLFYIIKLQKEERKYHPEWPKRDNKRFMFNDQVKDNIFRSCVIGVPIWTAYELLYIHLVGTGTVRIITFARNPVWFVLLILLLPLIRETHFYIAHKILHLGWLMRKVHRVHHMNINPNPWSGMAMHPIEQIMYLSVLLVYIVIPCHPIHFFLNAQLTALTPAQGHLGFEGPFFKGWLPAGDYFHYLHHKHVSCNFGSTSIPWDKWFGVYFNGEGKFVSRKVKLISREK